MYRSNILPTVPLEKGTEKSFLDFMAKINEIHPTIKFTHGYNLKEKSTTYLDTTISIKNGKLITDLYRKETDRVQYLLPNSCHPNHICKNVPYSLALRLVRICSEENTLKKRLNELKEMLLLRKYNRNVVNGAIEKILLLDRNQTLEKVPKKKNERVIISVKYHPKLPSVSKIIVKHWKTMTKDIEAKDAFPKPPMVAYRQPPNLKSVLCRAKLPKIKHSKRRKNGLQKCFGACDICPYTLTSKEFHSTQTSEKYEMKGCFNCNTAGIIYLITCTKCSKQYVGQTGRRLTDRAKEHLYYIKKKKEATGIHFSTQGHSNSDMKIQIIEKVMPNSPYMRLEREEMWIRKLLTKTPHGLNRLD